MNEQFLLIGGLFVLFWFYECYYSLGDYISLVAYDTKYIPIPLPSNSPNSPNNPNNPNNPSSLTLISSTHGVNGSPDNPDNPDNPDDNNTYTCEDLKNHGSKPYRLPLAAGNPAISHEYLYSFL